MHKTFYPKYIKESKPLYLTLPGAVDPEKITAIFKNGVLKVEIPKPEEKKSKLINIKVG
ncbi:MAG: Hsp20 family protein [Deltaproteobacteria bacterium]|nr:Hsp20 family protein [Deltaproteobacteria bacterium]